jgi:pimeloyl-ACP methyl ester carboxylesterase
MPTMEQMLSVSDRAGHKIAAILSRASNQTDRLVVLCHGFLSNKNSTTNKALTRVLNENGIATLRFDFFGQGESEGRFEAITVSTAIDQTIAVLDIAGSLGFRRLGLMGSSFGGLVVILTAAQRSDLAAIGLKCPVPDFPEMLRLEFSEAGMERWKQRDEIPDVAGGPNPIKLRFAFYKDCLHHDSYKAAESIQAPVRIVQGDCDEYVPLHQSHRLVEALHGPKDLRIIPGADHGFTKADDFHTMVTWLADWMIEYLVPHGR